MSERRRPGMRLTEEQHRRLAREAERNGMTQQAFAQAAVLAKIEESEARHSRRKKVQETVGPTGLFGGQPVAAVVARAAPVAAALPRLVKTPPHDSPSLVAGLADHVVRGDAVGRRGRLAEAVSVLRSVAPERARLEALSRELDDAVEARLKDVYGPRARAADAAPSSDLLMSRLLRGEDR